MKAVYVNQTGGADVLTYGDRPEPEIGPGEILRRVRARAQNHIFRGAIWPARWRKSALTPGLASTLKSATGRCRTTG